MPEIGIAETRNIMIVLQQKYDYDFSHYALIPFRYALDKLILNHHIINPELLIRRILEDDTFFDEFLFDITKTSGELFRDPETWELLKSTIFPQFFETFPKPKIWLPSASSGQDLFSLLILLKIEYPEKNITIDISSLSEKNIDRISSGQILKTDLLSGLTNFEKVFPHTDIYSLVKHKDSDYILDYSLFQGIHFTKQNLLFEPYPESPGMIIFRNNLLAYSPDHQNAVLDLLTSILEEGGYFITGIKENIDDFISKHNKLHLISKDEKIYKKIKYP